MPFLFLRLPDALLANDALCRLLCCRSFSSGSQAERRHHSPHSLFSEHGYSQYIIFKFQISINVLKRDRYSRLTLSAIATTIIVRSISHGRSRASVEILTLRRRSLSFVLRYFGCLVTLFPFLFLWLVHPSGYVVSLQRWALDRHRCGGLWGRH